MDNGVHMKNIEEWKDEVRKKIRPLIPEKSKVALLDFPNHGNVGDAAIWLGEVNFLKEELQDVKIIHVSEKSLIKRESPSFSKDTILLINGGGNFGDLWPSHQEHRELVIRNYPDNKVIQLPQSIYFQEEKNLRDCSVNFQQHKNFHLLVRDFQSLRIAQSMGIKNVQLCPDMAIFSKAESLKTANIYDIVFLVRKDRESIGEKLPTNLSNDKKILVIDWLEDKKDLWHSLDRILKRHPNLRAYISQFLFERLARRRLERGCQILSSGKRIVTDRLHAHLISMLIGKENIVIDNKYNKIGNYRESWPTESPANSLCESYLEAISELKMGNK
ncbi:polysaccharide pyruvyl transferase family protein [Marinobacter zhanjiangensis]|uniref:Exopolysaccharide biosynthesis protein n=1 Tax=Marinobacter zhanjiangensis TaxID=578215 RepID=A0ABQ3B9H1_9GAMM|nr:polysaccharide pyruvyl transferase family protein [Marinobacter zhanjiangensis]GGY80187.1 exopolysaccharide biosynthesis protein [Marinobacter zhanjiangensis]